MQTVMMNRMDDKELEKKVELLVAQSEPELPKSDVLDSTQENDAVDEEKQEFINSSSATVKNTVHVQHAHSFQTSVVQTTVLPRVLSEQSKLRILARVPAVQSMSSTPSEESNEDVPQENFSETRSLKHQTSSKDADTESGPPSLSSSRESSFDYTDSQGTDLNEFIMKTLKNQRDKKMLLKLEKDFLAFISDPRKVLLQYPPMTSYHRMIVHRVAAYFGLDHNVDPTGKCIIVNKCANTRFPEHRFTDLVREDSEEDPLPKLILKRQNSLSDESGPPERNSSHSRRSMEGKKSKSIEEREEEYKKARSRIFNHQHGSLSSQSSASSRDGESLLPAGLTDHDSESEKVKSIEYSESVGEKMVDITPPTFRVLTNRSRSPEEATVPKLTLDVGSNMDASSSASSAPLTTTVTDSKFDSSVLTRAVDTATASAEGVPYLARNMPGGDVAARSKMVEMIPQLSPNQTGGVVWTLPESQATYPAGQGPIFPAHETGGQMVGPDGFQASTVGVPPGITPTFFFPANQPTPASPTYQSQSARQATPPLQQSQGGFPAQVLPMAAQFVQPTTFPVFQPPRIYNQQDLEMLPQQNNPTGNAQGVITPNTGGSASNFQEISNQFAGMSLGALEQQENPGLAKQRGPNFPSSSTQTFATGQPVQFMVYRNISGAMVVTPVSNPGQVNPAYLYSNPNPHTFTQQGFNPQIYNQVYTQPFNQGFPLGEQTLITPVSGSHTPPTAAQTGSPLTTNPGFIQHVQTIPRTVPGQQLPTPVLNPGMAHIHTRLINPYGVQGQQVVQIPAGQQLYGYTPYAVGQNRPNLQHSAKYKAYVEKGANKSNDHYSPESSHLRRPSPSDSPRANSSTSTQSRRSGGGSGKGHHGKGEGQRSQYQQSRNRQKHRKGQHKHGGDSSRKQFQSGSSGLEMEHTKGVGSCVLEVYDVVSRDQQQVVNDLLQAGAKIIWNEKAKQSAGGKTLTARATFNSSEQAEQALMRNSNPNYKLRRCPGDIPSLES